MRPTRKSRFRLFASQSIVATGLLILVGVITAGVLLLPLPTSPAAVPLSLGEVSTQDILAPRALTYQSEVLTESTRQLAADGVVPQYAQLDPGIARTQVSKLRSTLEFISSVRADSFATVEQKSIDLAALQYVNLTSDSISQLLSLNDTNWQTVQQEAISVLEQVMRSSIREDRLEDARRSVPGLVSLSLTEEQAGLVVELVRSFVAPNSLYSEELTESKREAARQAVQPVMQSYVSGEIVVPRGKVIDGADLEALKEFNLLQPETTWKDYTSVVALVLINFAFIGMYFSQRPDLRNNTMSLVLMAVLFLVFFYGARLTIPNRTVIPYLFPVAGFSMLVAVLASSRAAIILALPIAILSAYGLSNSLELTLYYLFGCAFGVLMLRNAQRLLTYFAAGLGVAVSGAIVVLAFRIADPLTDAIGLFSLMAASGFNGLASASLTIILQFILAQALGLTTTLQLLDISRPDHPMLQELLRSSPGTYQHSLQIANLAEQAAERIGADALLTRVGALYHDVGKVRYSHYFIENQGPGSRNPHENLSPEESAAIIIQHITDGVEIANKHRIPKRIRDFILEHHGTMITRYQYFKAVNEAGGDADSVDPEPYRYPGPRPQSRETALVMLADGVEARTRAEQPENEEKLRALVADTIENRMSESQLYDTPLTLKDLDEIVDSFTNTLRGMYHPRIAYPPNESTRPRDQQPPEAKP